MNEFRARHVFYVTKGFDKPFHIVTVKGTEVSDVKAFKNVLLACKHRLHCIVEAQNYTLAAIAYHTMLAHELISLVAEVVIALGCGKLCHIFAKSAHWAVNRHVVVVEYNQQVVLVNRRIIDALERQAAANRCVANDGNHTAVGI